VNTIIKFQCPHQGCGEWFITTLKNVCSAAGFFCLSCNRQIHPSRVFGGRFGTGMLDFEKEFLAYIGSEVVNIDDIAQKHTYLVRTGKMSVARAQHEIWTGVEEIFRLVKIFKGYMYGHTDLHGAAGFPRHRTADREGYFCGGA
jgi:hypothetical protein